MKGNPKSKVSQVETNSHLSEWKQMKKKLLIILGKYHTRVHTHTHFTQTHTHLHFVGKITTVTNSYRLSIAVLCLIYDFIAVK